MGVDTCLKLPAAVQIKDVANAIGILLGKKKTWTDCSDSDSTRAGLAQPTEHGWANVEGVSMNAANTQVASAEIVIADIPKKYGSGWWLLYHFEFGNDGSRGMIGRSRAERICLHKRLAEFFGGECDYNDCDSIDPDYKGKPPKWLGKTGDPEFHARQMALWNLKPMTRKEIEDCEQYASYKNERQPDPLQDIEELVEKACAS